jgi:hypothetical protein
MRQCGQCRAHIGKCILRHCIAPTGLGVLVPKVVPSDDESLLDMESDVSDMEWEVAFPPEQFSVQWLSDGMLRKS